MDRLSEYVIKHSSCGMPRCEYVENGIEIDCDKCQEIMIQEHDKKIRADATRWIPCSERLPEKNGQYICTTTGNKVRVLGFSQNPHKLDSYDFLKNEKPCFYFYDSEWGYVKVDCVYAWMPLPEPYREEKKE